MQNGAVWFPPSSAWGREPARRPPAGINGSSRHSPEVSTGILNERWVQRRASRVPSDESPEQSSCSVEVRARPEIKFKPSAPRRHGPSTQNKRSRFPSSLVLSAPNSGRRTPFYR
ncbi:hypothetical protein EVG20_g7861 [Dentipellis fragilis]|uniref:Uncharacterized protein n=1 Tax=Dentipellis fragilis TaxID=205917 RepID=A0A4Y9YCD4_9AGAM|nr:hypothetical protein EVG20_g7861 [Dentipellis fragilis]